MCEWVRLRLSCRQCITHDGWTQRPIVNHCNFSNTWRRPRDSCAFVVVCFEMHREKTFGHVSLITHTHTHVCRQGNLMAIARFSSCDFDVLSFARAAAWRMPVQKRCARVRCVAVQRVTLQRVCSEHKIFIATFSLVIFPFSGSTNFINYIVNW